jgi:aspartyl-tRNA(Asn)/glutamyl-tRNA(Gln) amidotransferase subunit A
VVGLKQTFGRVSQRGLLVTSFNGDHIGPLTRSVRDSALMLQAIAGYDPLDPSTLPVPVPDFSALLGRELKGLTMGIPTNYYFDIIDAEVEATVRKAIAALEALGVEAKEVTLPSMQYAGALRIAGMVDSLVVHEPYLETHRQDYGSTVLYRTLAGQFVLARDYSKALKVQRIIKEEYARVLQEVDFLVTPAAPVAAWRIDTETVSLGGKTYPVRGPGAGMTARCTSPSNATGLPAMSIPCGFTAAGLPIGLQLIGRPFEEALLFQVAHGYEAVSPSRNRRPPIVAAA